MEILSVHDKEFRKYGRIVKGYDLQELMEALAATPLPEEGTAYVASEPSFEALPIKDQFSLNLYGGMPVQLGWCNGHNTHLNCFEYHRDSEINLGTEDFILLLAKRSQIRKGIIDSSKTVAFRIPAGTLVEIYATTLHFAPCHADPEKGFHVLVVLPEGTNTEKPEIRELNLEDKLLWARNKWLLAHKDSKQAAKGARIGISGENIDIANDI